MKQLILILMAISSAQLWAQDPNFSMFYNNPVYYNPAMTAISNGLTIRSQYRNLWTPVISRFNTFSVGAELESVGKIGFGVMATSDVSGEGMLRTNSGMLTYMYRPIEKENFLLQAGVSAGFVNKYIDWSKLTFSDQLDEVHGEVRESAFLDPNYRSVSYADFSAGIAARFNARRNKTGGAFRKMNGTAGIGVHHLTRPDDAFLGNGQHLPIKGVGHFGLNIQLNRAVISPGVIYERQNQFQTFTLGFNVTQEPFFAGIWFRNRSLALSPTRYDSFILMTGVNLRSGKNTKMRIAYSFDMTVSRLRSASIGTHEISLNLFFDDKVLFSARRSAKRIRDRYKCPEGFEYH